MDVKGVTGARWVLKSGLQTHSVEEIMRVGRVSPLLAQLLAIRGIAPADVESFITPEFSDIKPPEALPAIADAVNLIVDAIESKRRIAIYGDYDVDGITSIAILSRIFDLAGARHQFYIPHRVEEGYGLQSAAVEQLADEGVELLITVDCGISASEPVRMAKSRGLRVIITDHHQLPPELPPADVIVHPLVGADGTLKDLCAAGVVLKLAWGLAQRLSKARKVDGAYREVLLEATALAALGTIADVVPLIGDNRVTVTYGLKALRQWRSPGIDALSAICRRSGFGGRVDDEYIGFSIAPRLNAAGRMGHAREALELLLTADADIAASLAEELDRLNRQRQKTEREMFGRAVEMISSLPQVPECIVVHDEAWHPGVAGIVASRLVEHFGRPAFVLCRDGNVFSGSARGMAGFDVHAAIASAHRWIISGGGHSAAGGVKVSAENMIPFTEALARYTAEVIPEGGFVKTVEVDALLEADQIGPSLLFDLEKLAPFGMGNRRPRFLLPASVVDSPPRLCGLGGRTVQLTLRIGGRLIQAVGFRLGTLSSDLRRGMSIDAVVEFRPSLESRAHRPEFRLLDFRYSPAAVADSPARKSEAPVEALNPTAR